MDESVKVIIPPNVRYYSDTDADLELVSGQIYTLTPRQMRSIPLRGALRDGRVRVVEGHLEFPLHAGKVIIDGKEGGNTSVTLVNPDGKEIVQEFNMTLNKQPKSTPVQEISAAAPEFKLENVLKRKKK